MIEPASSLWLEGKWLVPALLVGLVLFFYAVPLFSSAASIQWDAVDVHYSAQKYFSDNLLAGKLPYWTPYVFSGMPFLADPQTGAWYPLNWPFFLAGITPRALEWELALHALLACFGAFLLTRDLVHDRSAALLAGVAYGFSGFFAAHSSHVGMFQTAALFPWLLWFFRRAVDGNWRKYGAATVLLGGCLVLIGHFQTALYAFFGLALLAAVMMATGEHGRRRRTALLMAATAVGASLLSAVQVLPGLELTLHSIRAAADFGKQTNSSLTPGALLTLVAPNFYRAASGEYRGPGDITQFYFYQGLPLPVLAIAGLLRGKVRWVALALAIPALWYAFGPPGGLYLAIAQLPAFKSVRAPVHIWFVVALGLAILAGSGAAYINQRWRKPWLVPALLAVLFADLWHWNSHRNVMAYGRASFEELYGARADNFDRACAPIRQDPLHRIWFEYDAATFGPMNGALNTRTEVTYGYNPLELQRYADYRAAAAANPRLLDGLAVTHRIDPRSGAIAPLASSLPRVSAPRAIIRAASPEEARRTLGQLNPATHAIAESALPGVRQDVGARVQIAAYEGDAYRIRYTAAAPTLLRVAVPHFPGWSAQVAGRPALVVPVDLALTGVVVPAGTNELLLAYRPTWFRTGAALSAIAALVAMAVMAWGIRG